MSDICVSGTCRANSGGYMVAASLPDGEAAPKSTSASATPPISPPYGAATMAGTAALSSPSEIVPPERRSSTVGLPSAATCATSSACSPGSVVIVRSSPSRSCDWSMPIASTIASAAAATLTAPATSLPVVPATEQPCACVVLPPLLAFVTAASSDGMQPKSLPSPGPVAASTQREPW